MWPIHYTRTNLSLSRSGTLGDSKRPAEFIVKYVRWNAENTTSYAISIFTNAGDAFTSPITLANGPSQALSIMAKRMHIGKLHIKGSTVVRILLRVGEVYQEMMVYLGVGNGLLGVPFRMEGGDRWCQFDVV